MADLDTSKQLNIVIGGQFAEYQAKVSEQMMGFLNEYKLQLEAKFDLERQALLKRIRELEGQLNTTGEVLQQTKGTTKRQDHLLDISFGLVSSRKTCIKVIKAWRSNASKRKRTTKMTDYCENFHTRGTMRKAIRAWKQGVDMRYRSRTQKIITKSKAEATQQAKIHLADELGLLRTMVAELTEDLRHESLAKENLQYQYEQALLRGMTALNVESLAIHQSSLDQARSMHESSKKHLQRHADSGISIGRL